LPLCCASVLKEVAHVRLQPHPPVVEQSCGLGETSALKAAAAEAIRKYPPTHPILRDELARAGRLQLIGWRGGRQLAAPCHRDRFRERAAERVLDPQATRQQTLA